MIPEAGLQLLEWWWTLQILNDVKQLRGKHDDLHGGGDDEEEEEDDDNVDNSNDNDNDEDG